ncbi:GDP-L-fucose synthase [Verrucomicrobia bacterium]|nr:GDP-L-fucose synthase [Verrucomicrobiota bacterium]
MKLEPKIFVAGHKGMVGSAIIRALEKKGFRTIVTRSREALDLCCQTSVCQFFADERPDQVYLAAARVGGIHANNTYPADFLYENLMIEANVIDASFRNGVKKLLFLGSSCIYPKLTQQPFREQDLMTGPLEPTNEPYAVAKIAGIKLCESFTRQYGVDYRSVMPTNLYGPNDNYHPTNSHVIPALIRRFHECKISESSYITVWGTGTPRREFLHVDDMADACLHVMNLERSAYEKITKPMLSHINIGCGEDISISDLAQLIAKIVSFKGEIRYDESMPDGTPQKLMDSSKLNQSGWKAKIQLGKGLYGAYKDFITRLTDSNG